METFVHCLLTALSMLIVFVAWRIPGQSRWLPRAAALMVMCFGIIDWGMLHYLTIINISYGSNLYSTIVLGLFRILPFLLIPVFLGRLQHPNPEKKPRFKASIVLSGILLLQAIILSAAFHALYIEPHDLQLTITSIDAPAFLPNQQPLRIAQITDTHVERITRRETAMLALLETYQPDLIVLTGDYVNADYTHDSTAIQHTRQLFSQLSAPYGVYAIVGNVDIWNQNLISEIFDGLDIILLEDEVHVLELPGGNLYILGVSTQNEAHDQAVLDRLMRDIPTDAYTLLLYHKPTLFDAAVAQDVDLFLAGHTHGGQVRLPLMTSMTDGFYQREWNASGLYSQNGTSMYISRGVGMEGLRFPRVRFLCPPEVAVFEIGPAETEIK